MLSTKSLLKGQCKHIYSLAKQKCKPNIVACIFFTGAAFILLQYCEWVNKNLACGLIEIAADIFQELYLLIRPIL